MNTPFLHLPAIAFFGRSFAEYRSFFGLCTRDLANRRVLDCAAGPSSFAVEAAAAGLDVTAVDPLYDRRECALRLIARAALRRMFAQLREKPELLTFDYFPSLAAAQDDRGRAVERFLADYYSGVALGRYVAGSLPNLPFDTDAFDLVLCGHLLFVHQALLDPDFHLAACLELCRVARDEVRIHPLTTPEGRRSDWVAPLRAALAAHGIASRIVSVDHAFFRGATETLILSPVGGTPALEAEQRRAGPDHLGSRRDPP